MLNSQDHQVLLRARYNPRYDANGRLCGVLKIASDFTSEIERQRGEQQAARLASKVAEQTDAAATDGAASVNEAVTLVQGIES
jgi:methyl-accepting chemotaxis protein